ncbi:MAG: hypothetical protein ACYDBB_17645 [Armatimonadota bacterium]
MMSHSQPQLAKELTTRLDALRTPERGIVCEVKGQMGCVRYHTHDTCIWQIDFMMADIP